MAYTNSVQRLIVEGGSWPTLKARIWMVTRTVGGPGPGAQRQQTVFEEATATGGSPATFTLQAGPSLLDETRRLCGLSLHEEGLSAIDGPLFRFGDVESLPTPAPEDPNGFVDCIELGPVTIDVSTVAARDPPFNQLPLSGGGNTVTSLVVAALNDGRVVVTAGGSVPNAFTCARFFRIRPSWDLITPTPFTVELAGEAESGTVSSDVRTFVRTTVINGFMTALTNAVTDAAIRAHAAITYPPVKPFLISGALPPGVTLSARRVAVRAPSELQCWPVTAGFGNVTDRLFPPSTREQPPSGGGACASSALNVLAGFTLDLTAFRALRDSGALSPRLIADYYRHSPEATALLGRRPDLAAEAVRIARLAAPALARPDRQAFPAAATARLLADVRAAGSVDLRRAIDRLVDDFPGLGLARASAGQ